MTAQVREPRVLPAAGLSDLLERRAERRPEYRGWCYLCGTPIHPGRRNWYCRSCAQAVGSR